MDPPSQPQPDADRESLRDEARKFICDMMQTTKCFDTLRNDLQAAVNELSQYDMRVYLDVTMKCDDLQNDMKDATIQSAKVLERDQNDPERMRSHIRMMTPILTQLRIHRNRVADWYLRAMVCENPPLWQLERSLNAHLSLIRRSVLGLLHTAMGEFYDWDVENILEEYRQAGRENRDG